jgi:glucans biosynthesis protein C
MLKLAGGLHGAYWSFYGNYLLHVGMIGNGPVWFIETLLLFSILYGAWRWLSRHRPHAAARTGKLPSYRAIYGFIFALSFVSFVVRIWWPAGVVFQPFNLPVGYLPQYISLFILGLIAYRRNWFFELSPRMGRYWLRTAIIAILVMIITATLFMIVGMGAAGTQMNYFTWVMGELNSYMGGFHWQAFVYAQ